MGAKGFEDSYCLSYYASEEFKALNPTELKSDTIDEDTEILVRAADLMLRQGKHQDGWIDGGAYRTHVPYYFTPDRFKEARAMACKMGFLQIGRRHKHYGNIVVFERNQFVGPQYWANIYVRRTEKKLP